MRGLSAHLPQYACTFALAAGLAMNLRAADATNWIAFNDHVSGALTGPNVTTYTVQNTVGFTVGGPLLNNADGNSLTAGVSITAAGSTLNGYAGSSTPPDPDTPADQIFTGKVDFSGSAFYFGANPYTASMTITFTNLDSGRRYMFRGTAVRGNNYANRWTLVSLVGAASSMPAHITGPSSPGIVTNGWSPYGDMLLPGTQAIFNSGHNKCGDVIGWDEIVPVDGAFSVVSSNFVTTYPNGTTTATYCYAINAFMLAEVGEATAVEFVTQPADSTVEELRPFSLTAQARGSVSSYQWYKDDLPIDGATRNTYSVARAQLTDAGNYYVVVTGVLNTITSTVAHVTVNADVTPPAVISAVPSANFTNIVLAFNEKLDENPSSPNFEGVNWGILPDTGIGVDLVIMTNSGTTLILVLNSPLPEDADITVSATAVYDLKGFQVDPANILTTNIALHTWKRSACSGLSFEVYTMPVTNNDITNLLYDANFLAHKPREAHTLGGFDTRLVYSTDANNHFGGRVRGFFIPPRTGNWRFFLRSDDSSELYFNPAGDTPSGKIKIAQQTGCCNAFVVTAPGGLSSDFYPLVGGQAYYIEGVYKEGTGGDYLQVAAALEGDPVPATPANNLDLCASCIPASWVGSPAAPPTLVGTVTISQQPADAVVLENTSATFRVGVQEDSGAPICYQWRSNGVDIAGATGPVLTQFATLAEDGAVFSVQLSTLGGASVLSREAILHVGNDVTPPTVVSVQADSTLTNVVVTFSEPVQSALAGDNSNYSIDGALVISATVSNETTVVLLPAELLTPCVNHTLTVSTIQDLASVTIEPTNITFMAEVALVLMAPEDGKPWRYDESGVDRSNSWHQVTYDDNAWATGSQLFDAKTPAPPGRTSVSGIPVTTQLFLTNSLYPSANVPTYYFRTHFNLNLDLSSVKSLRMRPVVDDGIVLYLNGTPVYSTPSMLTNAPFASYYPGTAVGDANYGAVTELSVSNLVRGDNLVAIELKNQSSGSSDITLGIELIATLTECIPADVRLSLSRSGGSTQITWSAAGYFLEHAPTVTGPWAPVDGAASPYTVDTATASGFYRLMKP